MTRRNFLKNAATVVAALQVPVAQHATAQASEPVVHRVEIQQFRFVPDTLKVRPGDRVVWVNRDIVPHTATAVDGNWDTGKIEANGVAEIAVVTASTNAYFCVYHPSMKGRLELVPVDA